MSVPDPIDEALDRALAEQAQAAQTAPAPQPAEPVVTPPTSGAEPTDPPKEATHMEQDLTDIRETLHSLVDSVGAVRKELADTTRDEEAIEQIAAKVTARVLMALEDRFAGLEKLINDTRPLGTPVVPTSQPLTPPKPKFGEAVFQAFNPIDRGMFYEPNETSKEVLERIITGLRGDYPSESEKDMAETIIDVVSDLRFDASVKFPRQLDEVIAEVFGSDKGGLFQRRSSSRRHAKEPSAPKPPRSAGSRPWGDR